MIQEPTQEPSFHGPEISSPRAPAAPGPMARSSARVVDRWGPGMALLLTAGILMVNILIQSAIGGGLAFVKMVQNRDLVVIENPEAGVEETLESLPEMEVTFQQALEAHFGWILSLSLILSTPLVVLGVMGLAKIRGPVREYLGLRGFTWKAAVLWTVACAAFLFGFEVLGRILERPPVPDFMVDAYTTIGYMPLLYIAIVVAAPVFEELLFRGFLLPSLADSRLGAVGGVVLSSALFAVIHLQYDPFDRTAVFGLGVLLGAARLHSRSTTLVILLHATINLVATVQAGWVIGG